MTIQELRSKIDRADALYYNGVESGIADSLYDEWKDKLTSLDPNDERLSRVGAPPLSGGLLEKREHRHFMGSQNKASTPEEFETWYKNTGEHPVFVNVKVDGASARAYYKNGKLEYVITRGDGKVGEDITDNAKLWIDLPHFVGSNFSGSVRGEAVLYTKEWQIVDPDMLSNPRNIGSGIIQRGDGENNDKMRFLAFDITFDDSKNITSESDKIKFLRNEGFNIAKGRICRNLSEITDVYKKIQEVRDTLPFWIDGLVVKIDDTVLQSRLGVSNNRPKGQVSFKFPPEKAETTLTDVVLAVGHTGAISITGVLDPVRLGGTTISNATLHNWDNINTLDVAIGDTVIIHKGGEIIPQIVEVKHRSDNRKLILEPTKCPECDGAVGRRERIIKKGGKVLTEPSAITECKNPDCEAKGEGKIKRFIAGVDILGMGDTLRETLYKNGMVRNVSDLYKLDVNALAQVKAGNVFGDKRAQSLIDEINKKRKLTIEQFMGSLGINSLARGRVADVCEKCPGEFEQVSDWLGTKIKDKAAEAGVPNIADRVYNSIQKIKPMIEELIGPIGITIIKKVEKPKVVGGKLSGMSFCLTGKFSRPKADIQKEIEDAGGTIESSVKKGLVYLLQADANSKSDKTKKAEKFGVKILDEDGLKELIDD